MDLLEKKILTICQKYNLIKANETVVVGVSGGSDSIALLHILFKISTPLNFRLIVAHVNHGLRPDEAEAERALVAKMAQKHNLIFTETIIDVESAAANQKKSIEQAARDLRYAFFAEIAAKHNALKIAVAHTADDQAEELLIRLLRGSGRKGLSGMSRIRDGVIIRPLLDVSKKELLRYIADNCLNFCEDSSNSEKKYLRNRIRLDLIPYLQKFNPNIKQTLNQTSLVLQEEELVLDEIAEQAFRQMVELPEMNGGLQAVIDCSKFNTLNVAIQRRVAEKVFLAMAAKPQFNNIATVVEFAAKNQSVSAHFQQGLRLIKKGAKLIFSYPEGKQSLRGNLYCPPENKLDIDLSIAQVGSYHIAEIDRTLIIKLLDYVPDRAVLLSEQADFIDAAKVDFPLQLHSRQPGDFFHPLGSSGRKKVGDFLIDNKVSIADRNELLLISSRGKVAAIVGMRIDHNCRIRSSTRKVLKIILL